MLNPYANQTWQFYLSRRNNRPPHPPPAIPPHPIAFREYIFPPRSLRKHDNFRMKFDQVYKNCSGGDTYSIEVPDDSTNSQAREREFPPTAEEHSSKEQASSSTGQTSSSFMEQAEPSPQGHPSKEAAGAAQPEPAAPVLGGPVRQRFFRRLLPGPFMAPPLLPPAAPVWRGPGLKRVEGRALAPLSFGIFPS